MSREKGRWKIEQLFGDGVQLGVDSLRRFDEGSPMFFVTLCGDVVRGLFARSAVAEMK